MRSIKLVIFGFFGCLKCLKYVVTFTTICHHVERIFLKEIKLPGILVVFAWCDLHLMYMGTTLVEKYVENTFFATFREINIPF